jgi:hypothetical protein
MKINVLAFVTIIGCTASAVRASTCEESSGICVCSGECPSFTADWSNVQSTTNPDVCAAVKEGSSSVSISDGVVNLDGETYTSMDACSGAAAGGSGGGGNSAGMIGAYYARAFVAAAAVAAGVAYAL